VSRTSFVVLVLALTACAADAPAGRAEPSAPAGSRTWAVVPVEQAADLTDLLCDALVRTHGARVARPGDPSNADRTLAVKIRRHDPYDPPRTTVGVELGRSDRAAGGRGHLDALVSSAAWGSGTARAPGSASFAFELVLDARDPATRSAIEAYVQQRSAPGGAFPAPDEVRLVQSRWMDFVAHEIVRRIPAE
jgi:hypothetical protein